MHTRELVMIAALLGACVSNPDPRSPTIQMMEREGYGGFIVIRTKVGMEVAGELISVESNVIRVLRLPQTTGALTWVPVTDIESAELYKYEAEGGFGAWGLLGTLSTISHGFWLVFSAPAWMISAGIAAGIESHHVVVRYPDDRWNEFVPWARFPQGMPPGLDEQALTRPRANRTTHTQPVHVPTMEEVQQQARRDAWTLTQQAEAAARQNDCPTVIALAARVQTMDADFFDTVFARDVAIQACLAAQLGQ